MSHLHWGNIYTDEKDLHRKWRLETEGIGYQGRFLNKPQSQKHHGNLCKHNHFSRADFCTEVSEDLHEKWRLETVLQKLPIGNTC